MFRDLAKTFESFIQRIVDRRPLGDVQCDERWTRDPLGERDEIYANRNPKLGIDFRVDRLGFPALQSLDPRVVRIAPGRNNELHKHAHESLFVVLQGHGEVVIDGRASPVRTGDVAFVPRWSMHQTRNRSPDEELIVLAITDFGLTSAVLGDYDRRTRLRHAGQDTR